MEFADLKIILSSFGLWVKVSGAYNPDGSIKDFKMLEKLTWHADGAETCLRVDPEGNFTAWRTSIVEPSADATANGSDGT